MDSRSRSPKNSLNAQLDRRTLLTSSLLGGVLAHPLFASTITPKSEGPVADTASGKVRGIVNGGVNVYRGIPYGASTSGSSRFMPSRKPESWTGVRNGFENGHTAPQIMPAASA